MALLNFYSRAYFYRTFDRLEVYVLKEHPTKRQASRLRLNQMKYDAQHLNVKFRKPYFNITISSLVLIR